MMEAAQRIWVVVVVLLYNGCSKNKTFQCPIKKSSKFVCPVVLYTRMGFFFGQVGRFNGTEERFFGTPDM